MPMLKTASRYYQDEQELPLGVVNPASEIKCYSPEEIENKYLVGDCEELLKGVDSDTFDLIVTSPPYADSREKTYGGIHPDNYVQWFLPKAKGFNDSFNSKKAQLINKLTKEFVNKFCNNNGQILWDKLVKFNSGNITKTDKRTLA